jgi:hypothetical protein
MFCASNNKVLFYNNQELFIFDTISASLINTFEISNITCISCCDNIVLIGTEKSELFYIKDASNLEKIYENTDIGPIQSITIRGSFVLIVGSKQAYHIKLENGDINYLHKKLNGHDSYMKGGDMSQDSLLFLTYSKNTIRLYDKRKLSLILWDYCIEKLEMKSYIDKIIFLNTEILVICKNKNLLILNTSLKTIFSTVLTEEITCIDYSWNKNYYLLGFNNRVEIYEPPFIKVAFIYTDDKYFTFINDGKKIISEKLKFYTISIQRNEFIEEKRENIYVNPFFQIKGTDTISEDEKTQCIFCLTNKSNVCLIPCGHVFSCINCSNIYISTKFPCAICRVIPTNAIKIFQ